MNGDYWAGLYKSASKNKRRIIIQVCIQVKITIVHPRTKAGAARRGIASLSRKNRRFAKRIDRIYFGKIFQNSKKKKKKKKNHNNSAL